MKAAELISSEAGILSLPTRLASAVTASFALAFALALRLLAPAQSDLAAMVSFVAWLIVAIPVFTGAMRGLLHREGTINPYYIDQFVALILLACFVGERHATGALVAVILILGQVLEERSVRGIQEAVKSLSRIVRVPARRITDIGTEEVDTDALAPGNRVRVLPGEVIPADGLVRSGASAIDQATITGESLPVDASPGDEVYAGTMNLSGPIEIEVTRAASDTVIGRVHAILKASGKDRPLIARRVDTCLRYYTPAVLLITGIAWIATRDLERAVTILVISLPCAFILSGPAVMVAALATCARIGILVKTPRHFETANSLDAIAFDKTGTLTEGKLKVLSVKTLSEEPMQPALGYVAQLTRSSNHPVARSITAHHTEIPAQSDDSSTQSEEVFGRGMRGRVQGHAVLVGSAVWLTENGVPLDECEDTPGSRTVFAAIDGLPALAFELSDTVRAEAAHTIKELYEQGLTQSILLTGDNEPSAKAVALAAGIANWRSTCLPEQKREAILQLRREGRQVLVVGDGVNDAPALAAGNLGIALNNSGAHIAVQTADVALLHNNLRGLVDFLRISKLSTRLISQNLAASAALIAICLGLSAFGIIGPLGAALLHEAGAFFVIANSARLLRYESK